MRGLTSQLLLHLFHYFEGFVEYWTASINQTEAYVQYFAGFRKAPVTATK